MGMPLTSQYGVPAMRLSLPVSFLPVMPTFGCRPG